MTSLFWLTTATPATGPAVTDLSWLAGIPQPLAWAVLATIALIVVLTHFGQPIRERLLTRKPVEKPQEIAPPPASALPAAVDTASRAHEAFIAHLQKQLAEHRQERDETVARLVNERNEARRQVESLQAEVMRLQQTLWQWRGPA